MAFYSFGKLVAGGLVLSALAFSPALAQDAQSDTPSVQPNTGATTTPTTPGTPDTANPSNGVSPESSSEADKPGGAIADQDVFGFDISMGTAKLTAEQMMAAKNTCRDQVTIDPTRYSSTVRSFCDQLK
ncbi:hypothetical protein OSH08_10615 [Kaistia geumhonensis]|uniref:Uncharacterized protein n=1 Tax=Kaistia geumhonensis TaxID=410839 RepID=A0ABU0M2Z1_9HYPH|nr:hypothetical protein [Kaistia geumhonensis]MCX5479459.1 hypothetical protein [Kaistia geumhonensis]MDQ0515318.1 hypothetical protein [Kaistia geumhonensis]